MSLNQFLSEGDPASPEKKRAELIAEVIRAVIGERNTPDDIITDIQTYLDVHPSLEVFMSQPTSSIYGLPRLYRYINRATMPVPQRFSRVALNELTDTQQQAVDQLYADARYHITMAAFQPEGRGLSPFTPADGDLVFTQIKNINLLDYIKGTDEVKEACRLGPDILNQRLAIEQSSPMASAQTGYVAQFQLRTRAQCRVRLQAIIAQLSDGEIAGWNYDDAAE